MFKMGKGVLLHVHFFEVVIFLIEIYICNFLIEIDGYTKIYLLDTIYVELHI